MGGPDRVNPWMLYGMCQETSKGQNKGYNPYLVAANVRLVVEVGGTAAERMEDIVGQDANVLVVQMFPRQVHPCVAADVKTMTCTRL